MGELKLEIADGIRMFKPKTLKEAISLARMQDNQLARQRTFTRLPSNNQALRDLQAPPMKRLSWEEMQKSRAQGLCFNGDEKFTLGHKCKGVQFLLLDGGGIDGECDELIDKVTM